MVGFPTRSQSLIFSMKVMKHILKNQIKVAAFLLLGLGLSCCFFQCQHDAGSKAQDVEFTLKVSNPSPFHRSDYLLKLPLADIKKGEHMIDISDLVVSTEDTEIPSQITDQYLLLLVDELKSGEEKQLYIKNGKPSTIPRKRTQAEISVKTGGHFENRKYIGGSFQNIQYLRVPDEHTDHSYYVRYEGPGWESDLVGYRFYLDWRNATDVFGKKTHDMVLQHVGLDGFDSYHEMQDWGVDVLKVGSSLGVGSMAMYDGQKAVRVDKTDSVICEIVENGPIYSAVKTNYYWWNVGSLSFDVTSVISIHAGTRLSHHEINITNQPDNLCTGIGKDDKAKLYVEQGSKTSWGYLASYGLQSLNNDHLGLAVFFAHQDYKGFTEDEFSHIVKLNVVDGKAKYYFLAAWEGEPDGLKNEEMFLAFVNETAGKLANPVALDLKESSR